MTTDLAIARSVTPTPIARIAADLGLHADELWLYGTTKAKVLHSSLAARVHNVDGKYIDVTAITPTPLDEGRRRPLGCCRGWPSAGNGRWRVSDNHRKAPHLASGEARLVAAMLRLSRWRTSISISLEICTRLQLHTT